MILGRIIGKITTTNFTFEIEKEARKFDYIQILHKVYDYVLCQIVEIERTDKDIAKCIIIGYKDDRGRIKQIRIPFDHGSEVLKAEDDFIKQVIKLDEGIAGGYIGKLEGKDIAVHLDLKKLLTKHVAILAKSGAGKSYAVGVLIEEIIDKKVPILVIDPHGEYSSLRFKNEEDKELMALYNIEPQGYKGVQEYGDSKLVPGARPLKLNSSMNASELISLIPGKLSNSQLGILYNALKHLQEINFSSVILALDQEENNTKWTLINNLEYLNNLSIFTNSLVSYNEMIMPGKCSIINMKGISPDVQEIIVYKMLKDLFELRKKEKIPPFFTVIEEAHNYCPERSFGETRCSKILRTVASEGRKFGLGLCVVSQRPARVDKSVLSQCTTQIMLKVTNPNDLKAISNSVEGITSEAETEIRNLPIGTAMVTGMVEMPLFVNIRPRKSRHGGQAADILDTQNTNDFLEEIEEFEEKEILPIIQPKTSVKDLMLMSEEKVSSIGMTLIPGYMFRCVEKGMEFNMLIEMIKGEVVTDIEDFRTRALPDLKHLDPKEIRILQLAYKLGEFEPTDLIKSGISIDIQESMKSLIDEGLIEGVDKFKLSERFIFTQLSTHACYEMVTHKNVAYNSKLEPVCNLDEIKERLSTFTKIIDQSECFVLKYDIVH